MVVGVLQVTVAIEGAYTLKEKRSVVRKIVDRTRNRFNVAVAEIELHELYNRALIGVSAVGNDSALINSVLDKVQDAIADIGIGMAEIVDVKLELIHV